MSDQWLVPSHSHNVLPDQNMSQGGTHVPEVLFTKVNHLFASPQHKRLWNEKRTMSFSAAERNSKTKFCQQLKLKTKDQEPIFSESFFFLMDDFCFFLLCFFRFLGHICTSLWQKIRKGPWKMKAKSSQVNLSHQRSKTYPYLFLRSKLFFSFVCSFSLADALILKLALFAEAFVFFLVYL